MKKVVCIMALCLMALTMTAQRWVDLGLPSGTLWKAENEAGGFYTYDQAIEKFGKSIPSLDRWKELNRVCRWFLTDNGIEVVGPNGASIVLPAAGGRDCDDNSVVGIGLIGCYWSSTPDVTEDLWWMGLENKFAWHMFFGLGSETRGVDSCKRCNGLSVRLVR